MTKIQFELIALLRATGPLTFVEIMDRRPGSREWIKKLLSKIATNRREPGRRSGVWHLRPDAELDALGNPHRPPSEIITDLLAAAGQHGLLTADISAQSTLSRSPIKAALQRGLESGVFGNHFDPGPRANHRLRWYLAEMKPENPPVGTILAKRASRAKVRQAPAAPQEHQKWRVLDSAKRHPTIKWSGDAVRPVKITTCPAYRDARFEVDTPPGWVGEITRDWLARRGCSA
jgi:hypothetical protein